MTTKPKPTTKAKPTKPYKDVVGLSDAGLLRLRDEVAAELARRGPAQTVDLSDIAGQETAKRALTVAVTGGHSLLLVGPPGCGKTMLRSAARQFGLIATFEARPCPCGYWNDPRHECTCKVPTLRKHVRTFPDADIFAELLPLPARELQSAMRRTSTADVRQAVTQTGNTPPRDLDECASEFLRSVTAELGLSAKDHHRVIEIAATIAALDGADRITSPHIAEAVNYRRHDMRRIYGTA